MIACWNQYTKAYWHEKIVEYISNENEPIYLFISPLARELVSSEYYIWNSTGDAPVSSGLVVLWQHLNNAHRP